MSVGHTEHPGRDESRKPNTSEVLGPLLDSFEPVLPDGTWDNFLAAFNKRCNYVDNGQAHPDLVLGATKLIASLMPVQLPEIHWTPELFETWVSKYPPEKQARMRKALDSFARYTPGEFANKEVFTKVELLLKRHKPDWAGRIVNKSSDLHNAMSGPIVTECLSRMKQVVEGNRARQFPVKFTLAYKGDEETMTERMGVKGNYIECDFSENDMRQCSTVTEIEGLWMTQLGAPAWLVHCHRQARVYTAFSRRHNTRARLSNQLPSGSTSTTFRNSLWNMTIFYTFANRHKLAAEVLILGDDMLARIEGRLFKRAARAYEHVCKQARMCAKVKIHKFVSECEFLSRNFLPSGHNSVFVPKLGKALARFNARANNNPGVTDVEYMAGKSLSYAYEFRHVERICTQFLLKCRETGVSLQDIKQSTLGYNASKVWEDGGYKSIISSLRLARKCSDDEATQFFHHRYHMTVLDVEQLTRTILFGESDVDAETAFILASKDFL